MERSREGGAASCFVQALVSLLPNPASQPLTRTLPWAPVGMVWVCGAIQGAGGWTSLPSPLGPLWADMGAEGTCGFLRPGRGQAARTSVGEMAGETCLACTRLDWSDTLTGG